MLSIVLAVFLICCASCYKHMRWYYEETYTNADKDKDGSWEIPKCKHTDNWEKTTFSVYPFLFLGDEYGILDEDAYREYSHARYDFEDIHPSAYSFVKCKLTDFNNFDQIWNLVGLDYFGVSLALLPLLLISPLIYFWLHSQSLTVTDKRVYGKAAFGKRVDMPINQVSSIGMSLFKGISVGTSSGSVKFKLVKNRDEIHYALGELLVTNQKNAAARPPANPMSVKATAPTPVPATSNADELLKYKSLLDAGAITEEEYNAKKKQLLGL